MIQLYPHTHVGRNALVTHLKATVFGLVVVLGFLGLNAARAATVTATVTGTLNWGTVSWSPGAPAAGDDIELTVTGNVTLNAIPATAFGQMTLFASGGNRTASLNCTGGPSWTRIIASQVGGTRAMNITVSGGALNCPIVEIIAGVGSTLQYGTLGWGTGNPLTIWINNSNHTVASNINAAFGKLTIGVRGATSRQLSFTLNNTNTTFTELELTNDGTGLVTVVSNTNRIRTSTIAGDLHISGRGTYNQNGLTTTAYNKVWATASGGNLTINGWHTSAVGVDLDLSADGSARTITLNGPGSPGSFGDITVNSNTTYAVNSATTVTGGISGDGSMNISSTLTMSGGSDINIGGNLTSSSAYTTTGDVIVAGSYTTSSTQVLTLSGTGTQALSWSSGTPVFAGINVTNTVGPISVAGNVDISGTQGLATAAVNGFSHTSGRFRYNLSGSSVLTNSGGGPVSFNDFAVQRTGGGPTLTISSSFTVNGNYQGNSSSTFNITVAATGPYTFTFKGNFDLDASTSSGSTWTTASPASPMTSKMVFEGASVNLRGKSLIAIGGTAPNIHLMDVEFNAPTGGCTVVGGSNHVSATTGFTVRDLIINGTNPVYWNSNATIWVSRNVVNNSTAEFIASKGDAVQNSNNGDKIIFHTGPTHNLGTVGGAALEIPGMHLEAGSSVTLNQDITITRGHTGGTDGPTLRSFGLVAGSSFHFGNNIVTMDAGTSATKFQQVFWSTAAGNVTSGADGGIYFKNAPVQARFNPTNSQTIGVLRIDGTLGTLFTLAAGQSLTISKLLLLESQLQTAAAAGIITVGNGAKIIRRTGSLNLGVGTAVTFPTAPDFYDLTYDGASDVTQGAEWTNAGVVRHLTIGPESGIANATRVNVATVGSRALVGNLVMNSNAAEALLTNVGLPIAAGQTVFRYSTGTVDKEPSYGATINIHYGGNFTTGLEMPSGVNASKLNNLTIDATAGNTVTLGSLASVGGDLTIASGNLDLSTFTADRQSAGGTLSLAATSTLFIGGAGTFPANYSSVSLLGGSTVDYNGTTQTISPQVYSNLTISGIRGANTVTMPAGTVEVNGVFTPSASFSGGGYSLDAANTVLFSGTDGQNIPAFNYNNLSSSNNNRTLTGTIGIASVFTPGSGVYTTTGSTVDYNGTGAQSVVALGYNNLTISGSRGANSVTLSGSIGVEGTLSFSASFGGGGYITTGSTVSFNGATQAIPNVPGVGYNNLTIAQTSGNASQSEDVNVSGTLTVTGGKLIMNSYALTIGNSGSVSISSPSGTRMLDLGAGGTVVKQFSAPSSVSFTWPIGTTSAYSPASISNFSATGSGSIGIQVFAINSPSVADPTVALDRYWNVSTTGLTITNVDASFTYLAGDVVGSEGAYVARRFAGGTWNNDGATILSRVITATGITSLAGEWTVGEPAAFAAVTIYFSLGGPWHTATSWSNAGFGGAPAALSPVSGDIVQIGDGKTITVDGTLTQAGSVQVQSSGVLEFTDVPNASNNLGTVTGTGLIRFNNSTSTTPPFPGGSFGTFVSGSGGEVEYAGTGNYTMPTQANYNRLTISGTGTKTCNTALTVVGTFTIASGSTFQPTANLALNNAAVLDGTVNQTAGTTTFGSGAAQNVSGSASSGSFGPVVISAGTSLSISANHLGVNGNLTNNSDAGFAINASAGTIQLGNSTGSASITGSGVGTLAFNNLTIGTGSSYSTTKDITIRGAFTNSSNGVSGVSFNQTAGVTTFNGGTTQAVNGTGTGTVTFSEVTLDGTTTLAPAASFAITGNLNVNSTAGVQVDATAGQVTFTGTGSTIDGSGTGTIAFYDLGISGGGRLVSNKDLNLRHDLVNNSTGVSGVSMNVTGVQFGIGGSIPQLIGGSGTGNLVFGDFVILPLASINVTSAISVSGNFENQSNGIAGVSFDQTAGTTTFNGTSTQTLSGTGTGSVAFNNLTIADGPSRINLSRSITLRGNLSNASSGISGFSLSGTAGTVTFDGTTAQSFTSTGSGEVAFNSISFTGAARLNASSSFAVAGDLTSTSTGSGSPATTLNCTSGTITFNGGAASSISGAGTGRIQFNAFTIANAPSRVNVSRDIYIAGAFANNSNGITSISLNNTGNTVFFNASGTQSISGTGGGQLNFHSLEIASGAAVSTSNQNFRFTGDFINSSNGVSGNSWSTVSSGSFTFLGGTTQNITGSGSGLIGIRGLTVNSGTRINCTEDIRNTTVNIAFNGSGLGSPAKVFSATAGTFTIAVSGGGEGMSGGAGIVEFHNLTLNSNTSGTYALSKDFNVNETLTLTSGTGGFAISGASSHTFNFKDIVNNSGGGGLLVSSPTGMRNHVVNISGNISITGTSAGLQLGSVVNGANVAHVTTNLTAASGTISGSGNAVFRTDRLVVNGNYTNTASGGGVVVGTDNALVTDYFDGTGTWTQGTNGRLTLNLQNSEFLLPLSNFSTAGTGNTLVLNSTLGDSRNLPGTSFQALTLNSPGGTFVPAGNTTVAGAFTLTAGTLPMGANNLYLGGSTTFLGSLTIGVNTVTFGGNVAQNVPALTYNNLIKEGTGVATLQGNAVVTGTFTLTAGTFDQGANTLTLGVNPGDVVNIVRGTGTITAAPTFIAGANYDYTYNSTSNANVNIGPEMLPASNTTDLRNLTINHTGSPANQVVMTANMTVNGTLALTAGRLSIGSRVFTYAGSSVTRTAGSITSINGASGSELVFTGSGDLSLPASTFSSSPAGFKNITLSRSGATVTFPAQDLSITGNVDFTVPGFFNTNGGIWDLGTSGALLSEANDRYVRGSVRAERAVVLPATTINFANMGVRMKNYTVNVGSNVQVTREAGVTSAISPGNSPGFSGNSSARTRWSVTNVTNQPTDGMELELSWFQDNDNTSGCGACNVNAMTIYSRPTASDPWSPLRHGAPWQDANAGGGLRKLWTRTTHFSDFTPGYQAAPLPITLMAFRGNLVKGGVRLSWNTVQEKDASHFVVERKQGAGEFEAIGQVEAAGNSSVLLTYAFLDNNATGNAYYRLKLVDQDGSYEYSPLVYVAAKKVERSLAVSPNPAQSWLLLNTTGFDPAAEVQASLIGSNGQQIWSGAATTQQLQVTINHLLPELAAGTYMIRLTDNDGAISTKFVKQ